MKVQCNYPLCSECKHQYTCSVKQVANKYLIEIESDIEYNLLQKNRIEKNLELYARTLKEITRGVYTTKHGVYTVPLINALGNPILEPSDVYSGLNWNSLVKQLENVNNLIFELRKKQLTIKKQLIRRKQRRDFIG